MSGRKIKRGMYIKFREKMEDMIRAKGKGTFTLYLVLRALVIAAGISAVFNERYEYVALCILVLFLFLLPSLLERQFKVELPSTLEKIILLFTFAAEVLGEMQAFYVKFPWWDTMLHTLNGFLCAAVGFALVDILNQHPNVKFSLSPFFLSFVAFCFSMTVGVLWEFIEFTMDMLFQLDMQKDTVVSVIGSIMLDPAGGNTPYIISGITDVAVNGRSLGLGGYLDIGLIDTMKDLIVNFIGAVVFSVIGYLYVKSRGQNKFAEQFIPVLSDAESPAESETVTPSGPSNTEQSACDDAR
jgi:hypothetical protein